MVAQHTNTPPDPPRSLSPETLMAIEAALRAVASESNAVTMAALTDAMILAGREGREKQLRAEDLLLVLKTIERASRVQLPEALQPGARGRSRLLSLMLEAYYSE